MKNFLIYKSSAGSGKTYTLVKEYLRLVLANPKDFRHTLAITFTNKAAEEMKRRVVEKLTDLARSKDPVLEKQLHEDGVNKNISIPERAKEVLENILHKYSYFSVTTIDSFFHRVIRSFARELKLQLGYDIEIDEDVVLVKVIDEIFDQIGEDKELRSYLENFVFYNIEEDGDWRVENKIKNLGKEIFKERYWEKKDQSHAELADSRGKMVEFISVMFAIVHSFESEMDKFSAAAAEILVKHRLSLADFPYGRAGYMNYLINCIPEKKYEPKARAREAYSNPAKWLTKNPHPNLRTAIGDGLKDLFIQAIDYYDNNHKKYNTAKELSRTVYILGIFNDMLEKLKEYRDENKVLLISDTNNILKKIISSESSPFIYEKIGTSYKHFLVDEFQDTSNYQWNNLLPLIINSLSEGNFSMLVGDVKQSIYRWRSGNMKLLLEKIDEDLAAFKELMQEKYLTDNWRSLKEIINFNNKFFEEAVKQVAERNGEYGSLITGAYKDILQTSGDGKEGGYVKAVFIPIDKDSEQTPEERSDGFMLDYIKELLDYGFELKDIMVLTRNNGEGSRAAQLLIGAGYKVVSSESLLITSSPKIKLLISLLKYISDNNAISKTEALFNYLTYIKIKDDTTGIFEDYKIIGDSLFNKSFPAEFFEPASDKINKNLSGLTLYELIENLVRIFELNAEADSYLLRFIDAVLEYTKKNNSDITGFIMWWEENCDKISVVVPEEENAIRVLTIHKAKGLQSPVVIIPYANWEFDISGGRDFIWASSEVEPFNRSSAFLVKAVKTLKESYFEKDYTDEYVLTNMDNLNLLYVAFTRAIERLYINCPEKPNNIFNAGKLIKNTLLGENNKDSAIKQYETGAAEKKKTKSSAPELSAYKIRSFISGDCTQEAIFLPRGKDIKFAWTQKAREKLNKGIVLHKALAMIGSAADIEKTVNRLLTEGLIKESETGYYIDELNQIISHADAAQWYSGKYELKPEREIIVPGKSTIRPDRVLIKDGKAILIDYKTGTETETHTEQINMYADVLQKAGYKDVEKYIYYITERKVKKV